MERNSKDIGIDDFQRISRSTAKYAEGAKSAHFMRLGYPAMGLADELSELIDKLVLIASGGAIVHAGNVLGKVKKAWRDKGGMLTEEATEAIIDELGDVYWYLAMMAAELGIDSSAILRRNISKLQDRRDRGVIQGDGDKR